MGYLMKEALKTLCGVNQWAYAVFWKIGCENPKLLIWEECYYEFGSCSGLPGTENSKAAFRDYDNFSSDVGAREKVHSLVNRMMIDSYVNVIGEGLVGRVAFTRNYQWILSENFLREARPPKVLEEVFEQFSAGMQTVAVIPVLPHGVVQFGSFFTIAENAVFVNDVTSLILQLGYASEENPSSMSNVNESPYFLDYVGVGEIRNDLQSNGNGTRITPMNAVAKAEVIPYNSGMWMNRDVYAPGSSSTIGSTERKIYSDVSDRGNFKSVGASGGVLMPNSGLRCYSGDGSASRASAKSRERCKSRVIGRPSVDSFSDMKWTADGNVSPNRLNFTSTSSFVSDSIDPLMTTSTPALQYDERHFSTEFDGACLPSQSGDDLFDVLGAEFKNKLFRGRRNSSPSNGSTHNTLWSTSLAGSEICSTSQGKSGSEIFCTEADNLLEAVVSKVRSSGKRSFDDNVSPGTTMTSTSSSPAHGTSLSYGRFGVKAGATSSCSLITGPELTSTCHSKKPGETSKTNRRRLKPGENSRPRPKDRQMIQDRVKELREIVPNGAKCSIDALLERTIKHMLFLQSVTKHADKLKQAGQSKIITKNGGATWAYEVGSQSMLCPIVVEDLNQPRQMFVEMLCEERGLFLEIADVIRGLGLTILKGVMEARNDKIWARFAVEANRDVTRMEIFISLVHLLEQSTKQLNGIGNENAAHVPVPDRLRKLQ